MASRPKIRELPKRPWQEISKEAQDHRDRSLSKVRPPLAKIPSKLPKNTTGIAEQMLTAEEIELTSKLPEDILALIASGDITSTEVCNAFLRRAVVAQQLVRAPILLKFMYFPIMIMN
jgi:amidase